MTARVSNGIDTTTVDSSALHCPLDVAASMLGVDLVEIHELIEAGYLTADGNQVLLSDVLVMRERLQPARRDTDLTRPGFLGRQCLTSAEHRPRWWVTLQLASTKSRWHTVCCTSCGCTWLTKADYARRLRRARAQRPKDRT